MSYTLFKKMPRHSRSGANPLLGRGDYVIDFFSNKRSRWSFCIASPVDQLVLDIFLFNILLIVLCEHSQEYLESRTLEISDSLRPDARISVRHVITFFIRKRYAFMHIKSTNKSAIMHILIAGG